MVKRGEWMRRGLDRVGSSRCGYGCGREGIGDVRGITRGRIWIVQGWRGGFSIWRFLNGMCG